MVLMVAGKECYHSLFAYGKLKNQNERIKKLVWSPLTRLAIKVKWNRIIFVFS